MPRESVNMEGFVARLDLDKQFDEIVAKVRGSTWQTVGTGSNAILGVALVGKAIVKLDKTSTFLRLRTSFLQLHWCSSELFKSGICSNGSH
jgi:hypothetical protein